MTAFLCASLSYVSFGSSWCCFKALHTLSIHLSLSLPQCLFPPTFIVVTGFATFLSSLLITWPYHERCFWVTCGDWLDHCITPELFISDSVFCPESMLASSSRLCASFAALLCVEPNTHCHMSKGSLTGTFLSQITSDNPLHEFHADRTLLSTSAPHPPVASIVEPKYLNELVHGIGTPAKQTSSLDPAG